MLPDNRIRLSPTKIDFESDVGTTGQDHDEYPPEGGQARFDHMRMVIIGLLAQQSSFNEPTEKRSGTPWFDLNTGILRVWYQGQWRLYSEIIPLIENDGEPITLAEWFNEVATSLGRLSPEIVYSGVANADNLSSIVIPESLRSHLFSDSRPIVHINGLLIDPRNSRLEPSSLPTSIKLTNNLLHTGDEFTIFIRRIPGSTFHTPSVVIP